MIRTLAALVPLVLLPAQPTGHSPWLQGRDIPPECVLVQIIAPDNHTAWVRGCGGAAGQESPFKDWLSNASREPIVMDGITAITPANCPKSNPCVILAENAPGS